MIFDNRKYNSSGRKLTKDELDARQYSKYKVKCKCGHYFYKDKKLEFMERLNYARKNNR